MSAAFAPTAADPIAAFRDRLVDRLWTGAIDLSGGQPTTATVLNVACDVAPRWPNGVAVSPLVLVLRPKAACKLGTLFPVLAATADENNPATMADLQLANQVWVYIDSNVALAAEQVAALVPEARGLPAVDPGGVLLLRANVNGNWSGGDFLGAALLAPALKDAALTGIVDTDGSVPVLRLTMPLAEGATGDLLRSASIGIGVPLVRGGPIADIDFGGTLAPLGDDLAIAVSARIPLDGGRLTARGVVALGDATKLFDSSGVASAVPDAPAAELELAAEIAVDQSSFRLDSVSFGLTAESITLVEQPVRLELRSVAFDVCIIDPLGWRGVIASAAATSAIDDIVLTCSARYPDERFEFALGAPIAIKVGALLSKLGIGGAASDIGDIDVTDLHLSYARRDQAFAAGFALKGDLGAGPFTLTGLAINVSHMRETSYELVASLSVGDIAFYVAGTYARYWSFAARVVSMLPIGHAVEQIGKHFGTPFALPEALAELQLHGLSLGFEKASEGARKITFGFGAVLPVDDRLVDVELNLDVDQQPGGRPAQYVFNGTVRIGQTRFALQFDNQGGGKGDLGSMLVATLDTPGGLTLQDVLDALPVPHIDAPFSLTVQSAFVLTGGAKDKRRTLVGMRLANAIDLDVLPVAGGALSGSAVSAMTLIYSSAAFSKDELTELAGAWSAAVPPLQDLQGAGQDLAAGIGFAAILKLADRTMPILLPRPVVRQQQARLRPLALGSAPSTVAWHDVGKTFGPVRLDRVGAGYENGHVWLMLDAGLVLGPLELDLQGLGLGFDLHAFKAPDVALSGMGLRLDAGAALSIDGQFLQSGGGYIGQAKVETAKMSLTAFGGYTPGGGGQGPSVLIFVRRDDPPLGGPPYAFVTGVSLGFGVNRLLVIPPLDDLPAFPLWHSASSPAIPKTSPPGTSSSDMLASVAERLAAVAPRAEGETWLAAGVDFTSFEMVQSSAMVDVSFGSRLEFALLGLSHIQVPRQTDHPILYAEIALEARCAPDSGVLTVEGKLTAASYVFMPDCHLTGGFAFYLWFAGAHAGDFVLSMGGSHPRFVAPGRPAYYPDVPRLGLSYRSGNLSVSGSQYFALTPSMLMAGMQMSATWDSGPISAWFDAGVDFLLGWQPFHYEGDAYIHIGASFEVDLLLFSFTMTIHVGVDLSIWGPPLGGRADIDLDVISFSVSFGADQAPPRPLSWDAFRQTLLANAPAQKRALRAMAETPGIDTELCTISVVRGLRGSPGKATPVDPAWTVKGGKAFDYQLDANAFALECRSQLASTDCPLVEHSTALGLLPMGNKPKDFTAKLEVTLSRCGEGADHTDPDSYHAMSPLPLNAEAIRGAGHSALYGSGPSTLQTAGLIQDALLGVRLSPAITKPETSQIAKLHDLLYDDDALPLPRNTSKPLAPASVHTHGPYAQDDKLTVPFADGSTRTCAGMQLTVLTQSPDAVLARRSALLVALPGLVPLLDAPAPAVEGLATAVLWDWPALRALGEEVAA
jgi:hypothetical protein